MKPRAPFLAIAIAITLMALAAAACGEALQGERIAFVSYRDGDSEIYAMNPDGSAVRRLTKNDAGDRNPVWSPDGRRIAFISNRDGNREIYAMNGYGSDVIRLTNNDAGDWSPVWSPDGRRVAFVSNRDSDGPPFPGHMPQINDEIYAVNADGTGTIRLTDNDFEDSAPACSPDGRRIAFVSERDGNADIYAMNADGTDITRLAGNDYDDYAPVWSPDGRRIAFVSHLLTPFPTGDGGKLHFLSSEIYAMNADGSDLTRLTNNDLEDRNPAWSPDGHRIAFVSSPGHAHAWVSVMNADGSSVTPLVSGHEFAWSADGQRIAVGDYPGDGDIVNGDNEIYMATIDGSEITQLTDNDHYDGAPSWRPAP